MRWLERARTDYARFLCGGSGDGSVQIVCDAIGRADHYCAALLGNAMDRPRGAVSHNPPPIPLRQLLVLPVADTCNLACRYCYEARRRETDRVGPMDVARFQQILEHVLPFIELPFEISLHGGEPLLAGHEFFAEAVRRIRQTPYGEGIRISVQTNATLIDEEWANLFRRLRIIVTLSLDGTAARHDLDRPDRSGRPSRPAVLHGIECLKNAGVPFGTTTVVSSDAAVPGAARELLGEFVKLGIFHFDVHPAWSEAPESRDVNLSPRAYAGYMKELFEAWIDARDSRIQIGFFEHFFQNMTGRRTNACYFSGRCMSVAGVTADGRVIPCTRPFDASYTFGNLATHTLPEIWQAENTKRFRDAEALGRTQALNCAWGPLCGGGCPHERRKDGQQAVDGSHVYCTCVETSEGGYPEIFSYMKSRVEELLSMH